MNIRQRLAPFDWGQWTGVPHKFYAMLASAQYIDSEGTPKTISGSDVLACAVLLANMINRARMDKNLNGNKGWFKMKSGRIQAYFSISKHVEARLIDLLCQAEFIKKSRRGLPASNWFRVNIKRIETAIGVIPDEDAIENDESPQNTEKSGKNQQDPSKNLVSRGSGKLQSRRDGKLQSRGSGKHFNNTLLNNNSPKGNGVSGETPAPRGSAGFVLAGRSSNPDLEMAATMQRVLRAKSILADWIPGKQARQFAAIRKTVGDGRLTAVFRWYIENIGNRSRLGLPSVTSPAQFRQRWEWIANKFDEHNDAAAPDVEITSTAQHIARRLFQVRTWTKEQREQLPAYVQKSLDDYTAFRRRLWELRESIIKSADGNTPQAQSQASLLKVFLGRMPDAFTYIEGWFEETVTWDRWNGNLAKAALDTTGKRFLRHAQSWTDSWDLIRGLLALTAP